MLYNRVTMLLSLALMMLIGFMLAGIFQLIKLPRLIGYLLTGILLGPFMLNVISDDIFLISTDLRYMALVIILLRAGLSLDVKSLKQRQKEVLLLSLIPATFEILAAVILGPILFDLTFLESLLIGSVLAAVSPAVIVPEMLEMMKKEEGTTRSIPQLIMASASLDDIYVIVLFSMFLTLSLGHTTSLLPIVELPLSLLLGIGVGILIGVVLPVMFKKIHMRDTFKVLWILAIGLLLIYIERETSLPFSGLIAVLAVGMTLLAQSPVLSKRLSLKYEKMWLFAELILFVLIGAALEFTYVETYLVNGLFMILGLIFFRSIGVLLSLSVSKITLKEKLFMLVAFIPKATVQASIAAIPLSLGIPNGSLILTVAVIAILVTAPLGSILIRYTKHHLIK